MSFLSREFNKLSAAIAIGTGFVFGCLFLGWGVVLGYAPIFWAVYAVFVCGAGFLFMLGFLFWFSIPRELLFLPPKPPKILSRLEQVYAETLEDVRMVRNTSRTSQELAESTITPPPISEDLSDKKSLNGFSVRKPLEVLENEGTSIVRVDEREI